MNCTPLYQWYNQNRRILPWRETDDPYRIWISEIILQQTRVSQGMDYYLRFVSRFPDLRSLAESAEDEVLLCWQGLGYYSRARNLHRAARMIWSEYGKMPVDYAGLRSMPGVGDYTAGAIASFAYNQPYPALDGNVYRVLARLFDSETVFDTSAGKRHFHQLAESILDRANPRLFNSALMELGALQCVPGQPDCDVCPLRTQCQANQAGTVSLLPVRKPRNSIRERFFVYTVYLCSNRTLIYQRQSRDIWQRLWEFPLSETGSLPPSSSVRTIYKDYVHLLSHQRIHARFVVRRVESLAPFLQELSSSLPSLRVVELSALSDYALPRLTERAVEELLPAVESLPH